MKRGSKFSFDAITLEGSGGCKFPRDAVSSFADFRGFSAQIEYSSSISRFFTEQPSDLTLNLTKFELIRKEIPSFYEERLVLSFKLPTSNCPAVELYLVHAE